ncbi:MAG: FAD/NAD(P)-binding oxidoreductase [Pseudomonadota bacterium]
MAGVVIVGAGQAGSSCAAKLRALGYTGPIDLVGKEPHPPYQRPPLSKKYLLGEMELERLFLRPESFYAENDITLHLGQDVTAIDPVAGTITLADEKLGFEHLVLTTGSHPRRLPPAMGGDLEGVHVVRDLAHVDDMAPDFSDGAHVLVVGGGYIGLEAAAVAAGKGLRVTLIEAADRILQRVASSETADYFRELHEGRGVEIREGAMLETLLGDGRVSGARLSDGSEIAVDFAVVGIGIAPATDLAEAAGLEIENGIRVDEKGRTSAGNVWAAGDCASFPHRGDRIRLESVPNAIDMAECVAGNIMGADKTYVPQPWFWSDQFDVKLQIAGLNTGYDRVVTRQTGAGISFWYYRGDDLVAVDAANDARAYMIGKRLIDAGKSADPEAVADPDADLRAFLKA